MIRTPKDMKLTNPDCGYVAQKLGFDNRRPFNMGLNDQKTENSPFKMTDGEYYYKIGGKTVTKAQYNAYDNPVGDGPTKSTNDPDASGNKAKIEKDRSTNKASKRPTALTKKQTELKNQGTKVPKKRPPFKKKDSPFKTEFSWKNALDNVQTGLLGAGMIPAVGNVADLINAGVSGGRAAYHKYKGNNKEALKHSGNAALNLAAAVPVAGQAVAGTRFAVNAGGKIAKTVKAVKKGKKVKEVVNRTDDVKNQITKKNTENKNNSTITVNGRAKSNKKIA
jgi:hypothetical protein